MDGTMRYDFGAIDGLAGDISSRISATENILSDLSNQVNNVTQIWEGSANEGFRVTKGKFEQAYGDLVQVLNQIKIAVTQTNEDAQATESKNASRWG
jgi:ESAT-6 family protein